VQGHVDVDEDEAGFRGGGVETVLEGADETEVGRSGREMGVDEAVVEEGVGAGVFHEGFEVATGRRGVSLGEGGREGGEGEGTYSSAQRAMGRAMLAGRTGRPRP